MARNFVILFAAREGSSAIVDSLSRHPEISVPIFEELDRFWVKKFYPDLDVTAEIASIFASNSFSREEDYGFRSFVSSDKRGQAVASIGFKWRPHGAPGQISQVFLEHDVRVFLLCRRDINELVASLLVSRETTGKQTDGNFHGQFQFSRMTAEEQAAYRSEVENQKIKLNTFKAFDLLLRRFFHAVRLRVWIWRLQRNGLQCHALSYEDFRDKPAEFFEGVFRELGVRVVPPESLVEGQIMQRASRVPATERVQNFDRLSRNPLFQAIGALYKSIISLK
ncbi:MAG: hypothetical protein AAF526_03555 [Pseudomonadota bacterium]